MAQCAKYCAGSRHCHQRNVSALIICRQTTQIKCPEAVTPRGTGLSAAQRRLCCAHFHLEVPFRAGRGAVIKAASISSGCARGAVAAGRLIRPRERADSRPEALRASIHGGSCSGGGGGGGGGGRTGREPAAAAATTHHLRRAFNMLSASYWPGMAVIRP